MHSSDDVIDKLLKLDENGFVASERRGSTGYLGMPPETCKTLSASHIESDYGFLK